MKIHRHFIKAVQHATCGDDLIPLVQQAIKLEHATIPPYLCGYFSLKVGTNGTVGSIIRSVVIEEMLHMTLASNLLIALGGKPEINSPTFVPDYPGGLPFGIGDDLQVHLRKCSIDQVKSIFMAIEKPDDPIDIPTARRFLIGAMEAKPEFETIGAFYTFLAHKIVELGQGIFIGDFDQEVVARKWFPDPDEMFLIDGPRTAVKAIKVIIDQGEGTSTDPFDESGEPAHYYRFQEIVKGRKLIHKPGSKPPYAFGGEPVVLDESEIWDMDDDPKASKYKQGSRSREMADQFNYSYTRLLSALHDAFNGTPSSLDHAMGLMYELRLLSQQVLATPAEWADASRTEKKMTGLSFEYQPLSL